MKFSLHARLQALELFWRSLLAAGPIMALLFLLTPLRGLWLYAATVVLGLVALQAWDYYQGRREIERMHRDVSFAHWLDQLEAQLRQYGETRDNRDLADWQIDFEAGLSARAAAKNFMGIGGVFRGE